MTSLSVVHSSRMRHSRQVLARNRPESVELGWHRQWVDRHIRAHDDVRATMRGVCGTHAACCGPLPPPRQPGCILQALQVPSHGQSGEAPLCAS